jgi:hypothetical protein
VDQVLEWLGCLNYQNTDLSIYEDIFITEEIKGFRLIKMTASEFMDLGVENKEHAAYLHEEVKSLLQHSGFYF